MGCWGLVIYAMTAATCSGNKALHCLTARDTRRAELCHNLGYKPHPCLLFPRQPFFRSTSTTLTWASRSSTSWERLDSPSVLATTQRETIAARKVRGCGGCNSWPCSSLLCRNCCHGHLSQCVCRHGDDQQHGCHLHEHLLLSLRSAGTVPWNERGANTRRWNILAAGYKLASNMFFLRLPSLIVASGCLLQYIHHSPGNSRRGFGIDCAILSCQVCVRNVSVGPSSFRLTGAVKNKLLVVIVFFCRCTSVRSWWLRLWAPSLKRLEVSVWFQWWPLGALFWDSSPPASWSFTRLQTARKERRLRSSKGD